MNIQSISNKSSFSNKLVVNSLIFKFSKKSTHNFSKSQPMRRSLFTKKKQFRVLNRPFNMLGIPGKVIRLEYDPYRSSGIILVYFKNKICSYYRSIHNVVVNQIILSSLKFDSLEDYKRGNSSTLIILPTSTQVNQIELLTSNKPKYSTSAGTCATLIRKNNFLKIAFLRLPSGIIKKLPIYSFATIGLVGNTSHSRKRLYKAGQNRWLGKRPIVRGVAKNPFDHPHGGGEGKKSQNMFPKTFWGKKLK